MKLSVSTVLVALATTNVSAKPNGIKSNLRGTSSEDNTANVTNPRGIPYMVPEDQQATTRIGNKEIRNEKNATHAIANSSRKTKKHGVKKDPDEVGLFEGDIVPDYFVASEYGSSVVKEFQEQGMIPKDDNLGSGDNLKNLVTNRRWSVRVNDLVKVPYSISSGFTNSERAEIVNSMNDLESRSKVVSCVSQVSEANYISVISGDGCYSYVGKIGNKQELSLSRSGCIQKGIIQHEFLHALGFYHEQSRPDRDSFVTINLQNIQPGRESNFEKRTASNNLGSQYDYGSVMHYGERAFSKNGQTTISAPQNIGQRDGADEEDILQMRLLYQCTSGARSVAQYNANRCSSDCKCWEAASGCNGNSDACQGALVCSNDRCVQPNTGGSCNDSPTGWYDADGSDYDCDWYGQGTNCNQHGDGYANFGKTANEACCACGGGL